MCVPTLSRVSIEALEEKKISCLQAVPPQILTLSTPQVPHTDLSRYTCDSPQSGFFVVTRNCHRHTHCYLEVLASTVSCL